MRKFEIGETYTMTSACDHEAAWTYEIIGRTAQTVTIADGKGTRRCRINKQITEESGRESIFPLGNYSMAPILRA